jgi:lipid II:glycine glycyltransferase (peptidoglycan interpeptide bridge formation enzyme)
MMIVRLINDKAVWEGFVGHHPNQNFLHSWNWSQMHRRLGREVYPVGFWNDRLQGVALYIKESAKRGPYLTCAGGPLISWQSPSQVATFVAFSRELAKACGAWFIRVRPQLPDSQEYRDLMRRHGFVVAPMHLTAETTWQLDLAPDEATLLTQMRKNHRYDIRKAERSGVTVTLSRDVSDSAAFYKMQRKTAQRKHWVPFAQRYLEEELRAFAHDGQALLFKASYRKKIVAMALFILYGKEAVYHQAASVTQAREVSAAYAIVWRAVQEAQKRGLGRLNFWGLAPETKINHRYRGMNLFKQGFGGYSVNFLPAHDLPVNPFYWLTYGFEWLRKVRRGL